MWNSPGPRISTEVLNAFPRIQVNVVASSLLALLLLPLMLRTSREKHTIPRTVVVSSAVHFWAGWWGEDITGQPGLLKALSDKETFK